MNIEELKNAVREVRGGRKQVTWDAESAKTYNDALNLVLDTCESVLAVWAKMPEKKGFYGLAEGNHLIDEAIDACTLAFAGMIPDAQYDCDHNGVAFVECTNDYEDGWNACRDAILSAMKGGVK